MTRLASKENDPSLAQASEKMENTGANGCLVSLKFEDGKSGIHNHLPRKSFGHLERKSWSSAGVCSTSCISSVIELPLRISRPIAYSVSALRLWPSLDPVRPLGECLSHEGAGRVPGGRAVPRAGEGGWRAPELSMALTSTALGFLGGLGAGGGS